MLPGRSLACRFTAWANALASAGVIGAVGLPDVARWARIRRRSIRSLGAVLGCCSQIGDDQRVWGVWLGAELRDEQGREVEAPVG